MPVSGGPLHRRDGLLAQQVFDLLSQAIVDGELSEGEPLHDRDIAAALGVSRTPVREALQRLQRMGLVEAVPHVGTTVAGVDEDLIVQTLEFSGLQSSMVVAAATGRLTSSERDEACRLLDALIDASAPSAFFQAGRDFVRFMTERTGNALLQQSMVETRLIVLRNLRHVRPVLGDAEERRAGYEAVKDAIRAGDADAAAAAFRRQHRLPLQPLR